MTTLTVRIPEELNKMLEEFCKAEDRSKSWILKKALQEKLEDWRDLNEGLKSLKEHKENPQTISHDQLLKELNINKKEIC